MTATAIRRIGRLRPPPLMPSRGHGRLGRHCSSAAIALLLAGSGIALSAPNAYAAVDQITLSVASDGTAPFDSIDVDASNGKVRTNDTVTYNWQYTTDGAEGRTVSFVQTLDAPTPAAVTFAPENITQCTGEGGGSISSDGRTLTCNIALPPNSSGSVPISVRVGGAARNGEQISTTLAAGGKTSAPVLTDIVAMPQLNLSKKHYSYPTTSIVDGVQGVTMTYGVAVEGPPLAKGSELVTEDLHWIDDLSQVSPNAKLVNCGPNTLATRLPNSKIGINPSAIPANSVTDSGTIACTQTGGAGTPIQVAVTGADLSGSHLPSNYPNTAFLATYNIMVFIPASDIVSAPEGRLSITNQLTGFDPNGVSGQSNFGEGFEPGGAPDVGLCAFDANNAGRANDNCWSSFIDSGAGPAGKLLTDSDKVFGPVGGATSLNSGNGTVAAGTKYFTQLRQDAGAVTTLPPTAMCDRWDPSTQQIVGPGAMYHTGLGAPGIVTSGYIVEYAVLPMSSDDDRRAASCDRGTWFSSIDAAGGPAVVNAVRITPDWSLQPGQGQRLHIQFVAMDNEAGTIIGDWAGTSAKATGGSWGQSTYVKETHAGGLGGRLFLTGATLRVTKGTVPAAVTDVFAGEPIKYELKPRVFNASPVDNQAPVTGVKVTDTLSSCVVYQEGSSSVPVAVAPGNNGADGVPCTGDVGETGQTLVFDLGAVTANNAIAPITYAVTTQATTPENTHAPNVAVISSDTAVAEDLALRTTRYDVIIRNQAQFAVAKTVDTPTVEIDNPYAYTITYRNLTSQVIDKAQLIDVLPYNGDSRGTSFTGTTAFAGTGSVPSGVVVECTTDAPATINADPAANTTIWSSDCPAETTGLRLTVSSVPAGGVGAVKVNFTPTENTAADVYVNDVAGARSSSSDLLIPPTPSVRVDVVSSSIGDFVWHDLNGNGIQDSGEPGIANFPVTLSGNDSKGNAVTLSTTTDANGKYRFDGLRSGTYTITFDPSGLGVGESFTTAHAGSDGMLDSDGDSVTGKTDPISLGIDSQDLGWDQGVVTETTTT
ncbi:SdrD B-like domain-containing protein, partial [Rhodococcus sp. APC 3903]|uniref:SdrD B-like domain-containing protein n=1 Tax=Rhodococcus sp. APC 3903 TaxID=3035193 RepID=UPI0025B62537